MYLILDTETTGLEPEQGHRICEIALLPVRDGKPLAPWVQRLNPERDLDARAAEINGLSWQLLRCEPRFYQIADALLTMTGGAHLVIHNAPFDVGFIDAEFRRVYPGWPGLRNQAAHITCTKELARQKIPGISHSLNNLCDHFGIARGDRDIKNHDALTDCLLLAQVYQHLISE
jgi:DNA polymerase-3 subunit epsilon